MTKLIEKNSETLRKIVKIKTLTGYFYLYLPKNFVPVVAKNKDFFVGYLKGNENIMSQIYTEDETLRFQVRLDSLRFIDLIMLNGKPIRLSDYTEDELKNMFATEIDNRKQFHPENKKKSESLLFSISCPICDNYYAFKNEEEIPEQSFFCGLCDNLIIDYTGLDDSEFGINKNPILTVNSSDKAIKDYYKHLQRELIRRSV